VVPQAALVYRQRDLPAAVVAVTAVRPLEMEAVEEVAAESV
jgi:transketolase C-terminal domain/subunit